MEMIKKYLKNKLEKTGTTYRIGGQLIMLSLIIMRIFDNFMETNYSLKFFGGEKFISKLKPFLFELIRVFSVVYNNPLNLIGIGVIYYVFGLIVFEIYNSFNNKNIIRDFLLLNAYKTKHFVSKILLLVSTTGFLFFCFLILTPGMTKNINLPCTKSIIMLSLFNVAVICFRVYEKKMYDKRQFAEYRLRNLLSILNISEAQTSEGGTILGQFAVIRDNKKLKYERYHLVEDSLYKRYLILRETIFLLENGGEKRVVKKYYDNSNINLAIQKFKQEKERRGGVAVRPFFFYKKLLTNLYRYGIMY